MQNVVKFPKAKRPVPAPAPAPALDAAKIKATVLKSSTLKSIFWWLFFIVRWPVFLVMYWLRMPVVLLCNLISFPMMLAWLFAWYAFPDKTQMVWGFCTISFLAFFIGWTYDFILMAISPQEMMKTL